MIFLVLLSIHSSVVTGQNCLLKDYNFEGQNVWTPESKDAETILDCQKLCHDQNECSYWSYNRREKKCFAKDAYAYDGLKEDKNFYSGYWNCKPDNKTLITTTTKPPTTTHPLVTPPAVTPPKVTPLPITTPPNTQTITCLLKDTGPEKDSTIRTVPNVDDSAGCQFACLTFKECKFWAFQSKNKECSLLKDDKKGQSKDFTYGERLCNPTSDVIDQTDSCERTKTSHWFHNQGSLKQPSGITNKDGCISECGKLESCKFWSFYKKDTNTMCSLLENVDNIMIGKALDGYSIGCKKK